MSIPTREGLKDKAKVIRKFMKEKYNADVSHGHCMEMISQLFGFKDWNTASAALGTKSKQNSLPIPVKTVGDMKKALEQFKDTDSIDADYKFRLGDFLEDIDQFNRADDEIYQEFSLALADTTEDIIIFKLELEHESISQAL